MGVTENWTLNMGVTNSAPLTLVSHAVCRSMKYGQCTDVNKIGQIGLSVHFSWTIELRAQAITGAHKIVGNPSDAILVRSVHKHISLSNRIAGP